MYVLMNYFLLWSVAQTQRCLKEILIVNACSVVFYLGIYNLKYFPPKNFEFIFLTIMLERINKT